MKATGGLHDRLPGADHGTRRSAHPPTGEDTARDAVAALLGSLAGKSRIIVVAMNDDGALGALDAAKAAGRESDVWVSGQGAEPRVRDLIRTDEHYLGDAAVLSGAVRGHHRSRHARPGRRPRPSRSSPLEPAWWTARRSGRSIRADPPRSARGRSQARVFGVRTPRPSRPGPQAITSSSIASRGVVASKSRIAFALRTSGRGSERRTGTGCPTRSGTRRRAAASARSSPRARGS